MKGRTATVLLVEDNPDDLDLAMHAFRQENVDHLIQVARDGVEALEMLLGTTGDLTPLPRVVLLDMKLPKLDGLEVLRQLRADSRTQLLPVVMLTSSGQERDVIESYQLGVNSYIVKPVDFEQFVEVIRQLGLYWLVLNQPPPGG